MKLIELVRRIVRFREVRDWGQFHTPKNLAAAVSIEASEIQELLLWKTDTEVLEFVHSTKGKGRLEEEIADVLIYTLLLSFEVGIDPSKAIQRKLVLNAQKYPVSLAKGNAIKYSERLGSQSTDRQEPSTDGERTPPSQEPLFPADPPRVI